MPALTRDPNRPRPAWMQEVVDKMRPQIVELHEKARQVRRDHIDTLNSITDVSMRRGLLRRFGLSEAVLTEEERPCDCSYCAPSSSREASA